MGCIESTEQGAHGNRNMSALPRQDPNERRVYAGQEAETEGVFLKHLGHDQPRAQ